MKTENLNRWISIVANIAILVGLIFVFVELRQNRYALTAQSADSIAESPPPTTIIFLPAICSGSINRYATF